jgi:hypothetical protein
VKNGSWPYASWWEQVSVPEGHCGSRALSPQQAECSGFSNWLLATWVCFQVWSEIVLFYFEQFKTMNNCFSERLETLIHSLCEGDIHCRWLWSGRGSDENPQKCLSRRAWWLVILPSLAEDHSGQKEPSSWQVVCSCSRSSLLAAGVCCWPGLKNELLWGLENQEITVAQVVFRHPATVLG